MKTSKQQLLAMLRHRLLPERSRRATRWHVLMLMLALLIGGSPQARAWEISKTLSDYGGGEFRYTAYSTVFAYKDHPTWPWLRTYKMFDINNEQFYCDFEILAQYSYSDDKYDMSRQENFLYVGEIFLVTSDDIKHLVKTWKKDYLQKSLITSETKNDTWGTVSVSNNIDGRLIKVYYTPSGKCI